MRKQASPSGDGAGPADPASFFEATWRDAAARHGARAAEDAALLGLSPLTIRVKDGAWTLQPAANGIEVVPGTGGARTSGHCRGKTQAETEVQSRRCPGRR